MTNQNLLQTCRSGLVNRFCNLIFKCCDNSVTRLMDDMETFPMLYTLFDEVAAVRESKPHISCDMWGSCTPCNISKKIRRTNCLKPLHRELLRQFVDICAKAGIEAFVYSGTALGVYREGGRMIAFDYDVDFATFEYPFDGEDGNLGRLANFCLSEGSNTKVINIDGLKYNPPADATVCVDFLNVFEPSTPWFSINTDGKVIEKAFDGCGAKRAKFYFTPHGLQDAAKKVGQVKASVLNELSKDLTDIHIDLFTLSPHPDSPGEHLRVNWHRRGLYNSLKKKFSYRHFLPPQKVIFENVEVYAPANLEGYLKVEYGYLGRDAMYDSATQCYIKIPEEFRESLPPNYQKYINEAFCWRCKIHEIWKPKPAPGDDILRRMHSEAAVFNAVYRCKNSTVPTEEKINQTIKFLEENEFWRTNSLSLFANHVDPGVVRVVKILQKQEVRDIWNREEPSEQKENSKDQSNESTQTSANNLQESGKSVTWDKVKTDGSMKVDDQKSDFATNTNNRTNMSHYPHNSQFQNTSLVPVSREWVPSYNVRTAAVDQTNTVLYNDN